jgi:hypothetical protein
MEGFPAVERMRASEWMRKKFLLPTKYDDIMLVAPEELPKPA